METNNKLATTTTNEAKLIDLQKVELNRAIVETVFSNDSAPNLSGGVGISVKVKKQDILIVLDDKTKTLLYANRMLKNNLAVKMRFKTLGGLPVIKMENFVIGQNTTQGIRLPKVDESLLKTVNFNKSLQSYASVENVAMVKRQLDILLSLESEDTNEIGNEVENIEDTENKAIEASETTTLKVD